MNAYIPILVLGVIAMAFAVVSVVLASVVGPKRYNRAKLEAYECGIEPAPRAWHARILPLDHGRVRCAGIEPASKRWERFILPLNEHRAASAVGESGFSAGRAWSRPTETPGSPIHQVALPSLSDGRNQYRAWDSNPPEPLCKSGVLPENEPGITAWGCHAGRDGNWSARRAPDTLLVALRRLQPRRRFPTDLVRDAGVAPAFPACRAGVLLEG